MSDAEGSRGGCQVGLPARKGEWIGRVYNKPSGTEWDVYSDGRAYCPIFMEPMLRIGRGCWIPKMMAYSYHSIVLREHTPGDKEYVMYAPTGVYGVSRVGLIDQLENEYTRYVCSKIIES